MYEALTYDMRVRVVRQNKYSGYKLLGRIGNVKTSYSCGSIPVEFDDLHNVNSSYGYFYFKRSDLEIVNDDNNNTEGNNMANVTNYLNAVKIKFVDDTKVCGYIYANYEYDIKVGDLCVVKSAHHGLGLARIVEIIDQNDFETTREIVAKVETGSYDTRVELRAKAAELKAKMQERARKLQDVALYQMLAEKDSEMQELLNQYQALPEM